MNNKALLDVYNIYIYNTIQYKLYNTLLPNIPLMSHDSWVMSHDSSARKNPTNIASLAVTDADNDASQTGPTNSGTGDKALSSRKS